MESFELLFDVVGEEVLLAARVLGAEGGGERSEQSFAARDDGGEIDFFPRPRVEGRAALAMHRVNAAGELGAEAAEADHALVDAPPFRDDGVVEVGDFFEEAALAVAVFAFIGEIEALFRSLRLVLVPGVEGARERFAPFAFDVEHGMAAVGHAFAVGIQGLDAMIFDEEPRHGGFEGAGGLKAVGVRRHARDFPDRVLLRSLGGWREREAARERRERCKQQGGCKGEGTELFHGDSSLYDRLGM